MGRYSYWISGLTDIETVDDAIERLDFGKLDVERWNLSLEVREHVWAVCNRGKPQFWRASREEAEAIAERPSPIPWDVTYFEEVWLVITGDQYIFTASTRAEAEGFIFGMLGYSALNS
jgi:hypothetical protein